MLKIRLSLLNLSLKINFVSIVTKIKKIYNFQAPLGTFQKPGEDNGGQFHSILPMPD
jgi:hypothetical protein